MYPLLFEPHSHLPPHPIPLGWYRAPVWVSWAIQLIPVGYLFKRRDIIQRHIQKQRHYFANKGLSSQGYGFSSGHVWMWELDHNKEGWAPKNWCFWTVVLEKTLESPLDCKVIKPVNPKEISPEYSLDGLMLKLKLQYFGHLMGWADSLKTLMPGKIEGRRRREQQRKDSWMISPTWWTGVSTRAGRWWRTQKPGMLMSMGSLSWTWLSDWTTTIYMSIPISQFVPPFFLPWYP